MAFLTFLIILEGVCRIDFLVNQAKDNKLKMIPQMNEKLDLRICCFCIKRPEIPKSSKQYHRNLLHFNQRRYKFIFIMTLLYTLLPLVPLVAIVFLFLKCYYRPRKEMKRFTALAKSLGYSIYEEEFCFLSGSIFESLDKGKKLHGDALHFEKIIHPHFDMTVGNLADRLYITLINPDLIKDFFKAQNVSIYTKYQPPMIAVKNVFGEGLVFSQGSVWKNKRKLLSKLFNFELLKENIPKIIDICNYSLKHFDKRSQKGQGEFEYDINKLTSSITNLIMLQCFFGCDKMELQINGKQFGDFVTDIVTKAAQLPLNPLNIVCGKFAYQVGLTQSIRNMNAEIGIFRNKLKDLLKERIQEIGQEKEAEKCTDLIQAMVYEKRKNKEEFNFSDQDLLDEFSTFLIAGTDTTSRLVSVMVYYISKYPQVQRRLREEINKYIFSDADITIENLKNLAFIEMTINETLRFYGPANGIFFRIAEQDNYILDLPIPKGTTLFIQPIGNHYNPKFYKDPEVFRPERWEKQCDNLHPYAFLAFSGGPRSCIGKQLALLEAKILLIKILKRYDHFKGPDKITFTFNFVYEADPFLMSFSKDSQKQ